jgi:hypothetical protein
MFCCSASLNPGYRSTYLWRRRPFRSNFIIFILIHFWETDALSLYFLYNLLLSLVKAMIVDKIKDNYPLGNLAQNLAFSLQMKGTSSDMAYTQYHGEIQALQ